MKGNDAIHNANKEWISNPHLNFYEISTRSSFQINTPTHIILLNLYTPLIVRSDSSKFSFYLLYLQPMNLDLEYRDVMFQGIVLLRYWIKILGTGLTSLCFDGGRRDFTTENISRRFFIGLRSQASEVLHVCKKRDVSISLSIISPLISLSCS